MTDALFPPTPAERLAALEAFITDELRHREHMIWRHPESERYWHERADDARRALAHVEALIGEFG